MTTNEELTWDDLADLYGKRTGGRARTMPMNAIFNWAITQPDIEETADGGLIIKETTDKVTQ